MDGARVSGAGGESGGAAEPEGFCGTRKTLCVNSGSRRAGMGIIPSAFCFRMAPGNEATIRGFSNAALVLIDEASRVPEVLYQALRPMLARSNGDLWMMSTPNGAAGFFWETWVGGGEEWEKISAPAVECERISAEFLARERSGTDAGWFAQEYLCRFVDNGAQMFTRDLLDQALDDEEPWRF